jgi:hypothetical protein
MNEADFKLLQGVPSGAWELDPIVKHDRELRQRALELSIQCTAAFRADGATNDVDRARIYYNFLKGDDDDANLHSQE